jgi:hypothetical protein
VKLQNLPAVVRFEEPILCQRTGYDPVMSKKNLIMGGRDLKMEISE